MTTEEKRRELFESLYPPPSGVCFGGSGSYVVFHQPSLLGAELSRREYNQLWGCFNKALDAVVIELPHDVSHVTSPIFEEGRDAVLDAIESTELGLKVK